MFLETSSITEVNYLLTPYRRIQIVLRVSNRQMVIIAKNDNQQAKTFLCC